MAVRKEEKLSNCIHKHSAISLRERLVLKNIEVTVTIQVMFHTLMLIPASEYGHVTVLSFLMTSQKPVSVLTPPPSNTNETPVAKVGRGGGGLTDMHSRSITSGEA